MEKRLQKNYSYFINALIFVFPIVINSVKVAGDLVLLILAVIGIFLSIYYKISPFSIKDLKLLNCLTLGYFAVICVSILFSGKALELAHFISRELYFLFAPFIALAIYKAKVNISIVLYGVKIALIMFAILVYLHAGSFDVRYSGVMNANSYGAIASVMTLFAITRICKERPINQLLTSVAFISGLLVVLSSGTRGAWIALIVALVLYFWGVWKSKEIKGHLKLFVLLSIMTIIASNFVKFPNLEQRVVAASQQVSDWFEGKDVNSSVSVRMEMWDASTKQVFDQLPLSGFGYRNNINSIIAKHADPKAQQQIPLYNHVHNTYLNHLLAEGPLGFIALLSLLFFPFRLFILGVKDNSSHETCYSRMGMIFILMLAVYGFTNKLFGDIFINAFYVFYLALLLPIVIKGMRKNPPS